MTEVNIGSKISAAQGLPGGVFWCTVVAIIMYAIGYSTTGWQFFGNKWVGLWSSCSTSLGHPYADEVWFQSTRFVSTVGLIFFVISFLAIYMNLFVEKVIINKPLLMILFIIFAFLTVIFIVIGLAIFGINSERESLHWSYALVVIAVVLLFVAIILAIILLKK